MKVEKSGNIEHYTDENAIGYSIWRNIGQYDTKEKTVKFFDGKWFKYIFEEGTRKPKVFPTKDDAIRSMVKYNKEAKDALNKETN